MSNNLARAAKRHLQRVLSGNGRVVAGQPTHETHPEVCTYESLFTVVALHIFCKITIAVFKMQLLAEGDISPGISAAEFAERRDKLARSLPPGGLAVLQAAPQTFMTGVIPYPYRQDADFRYLTGISQPGVVGVVRSDGKFTLFVPDRDPWRETWDGARVCVNAAVAVFGADEAYPMSQMPDRLTPMLAAAPTVAMEEERPDVAPLASAVAGLPAARAANGQGRVVSLRPLVHELRWIKSRAEMDAMCRSASAAANAMVEAMRRTRPGTNERSMASVFEYYCKIMGAERMAYPPVVASGADGCTIHYSRNDKRLCEGGLLLFDGGCEVDGYCSDVTRTWPISGKFAGPQRAVYEAVLSVYTGVLEAVKPGVTLRQLHQRSVRLTAEVIRDLGLMREHSVDAIIDRQYFRKLYPHSIGHWLGMDTHDASTISHDRPIVPGVVLTVEPGLYIPASEENGPFGGIGIRLEDDVAVTQEGSEVLSAQVPLGIADVEALIGTSTTMVVP